MEKEIYKQIIKDLLDQISLLYLMNCLPQIEVRRNSEIIFTYKWTSIETEQVYYDLLSKLSYFELKRKEIEEKDNLYRTIQK